MTESAGAVWLCTTDTDPRGRGEQQSRVHDGSVSPREFTKTVRIGRGGGLGRGPEAANRATRKGKHCPRLRRGAYVQGTVASVLFPELEGLNQVTCRGHRWGEGPGGRRAHE